MLWFSLFIVSLIMLGGWFWQILSKNAGIVDVLWAFSLSFLALFHLLTSEGYLPQSIMASGIMLLWYLRLGTHLAQRVLGEDEDGRYKYLRQYWGAKTNFYHFFFFQFQALLAWGFAIPVWFINQGQIETLGLAQYAGLVVAIIAITGVTVADKQLANFKADPKNKGEVCETGLWNYSRHPNYFFEWLHWFSYPLMAIGIEHAAWLWLAPLVMLLFLYFITGIPYTEQHAIRSRGDKYRRYQQTTSAFIPWRKKNMSLITIAEKGLIPDMLVRVGIRMLLKQRLQDEKAYDLQAASEIKNQCMEMLRNSPIAIETQAANEQHYEVPAEFYQLTLGKHLKYSGCWWDDYTISLDQAEKAMLDIYLERGDFKNGQDILELGCGWGSLTLHLAERFPYSRITAVSNSDSQREFIEKQAFARGLTNIRIITCDVNKLELNTQFDRIVSIEMFEHMRNYQQLLNNVSCWLKSDGKLFVHIFCHRNVVYPFETEGDDNWMGRYFFTGGLMPSADTLLHFQDALQIEKQWLVNGQHYQKTAEAWLKNTDKNARQIKALFDQTYGKGEGAIWLQRWRLFFMACAELFGYHDGTEWLVTHYLFAKRVN